MKKYLAIIAMAGVGVCTLGLVLAGCFRASAEPEEPNVLIILLDALRADHVGCYGYERNTTPNIDAFARDCVVYTNCYATSSWTAPSVTSLLTGLNCRQHGVLASWDPLREDLPYLPAQMQVRGYATAGFVDSVFVLENKGYARGMEHWWHVFPELKEWSELRHVYSRVDPDDAVLVNQAIPWIRQAREPWFAYVHLFGPHNPYRAAADPEYFGTGEMNLYDAKTRYADRQFGRLLAELLRHTVVIVTADHGELFGEHGCTGHGSSLCDELLRVPLLIRWPGHEPRVERGLMGLDRIAPAILDGALPETGGEVRCHLEMRWVDARLLDVLTRTVTEADLPDVVAPAVDAETVRKAQLEALGYL